MLHLAYPQRLNPSTLHNLNTFLYQILIAEINLMQITTILILHLFNINLSYDILHHNQISFLKRFICKNTSSFVLSLFYLYVAYEIYYLFLL